MTDCRSRLCCAPVGYVCLGNGVVPTPGGVDLPKRQRPLDEHSGDDRVFAFSLHLTSQDDQAAASAHWECPESDKQYVTSGQQEHVQAGIIQ